MNKNGKPAGRSESETHFTLISPERIELLGRRKWYLIGPVLFSLALGAFYLLQVPPMYHIQARVLVQRRGLPLSQDQPTKDNVEFLATQAEIIRSPAIVEEAVRSLDFIPYEQSEIGPTVQILKSLKVQPVLGTNVLSIDFYGPEPGQATKIVEAIIESYRRYLYGIDHDAHLESLRVLTRSERDLRLDLSELERQYLNLRKKSPLMGQGKDAISVQRILLTHLGQKLTDARNRRIELENRLQTLGNAPHSAVAAASPAQPALFTASLSKPWQPNESIFQSGNNRAAPGTSVHDGTLPLDFERWYAAAENGGIKLGDLRPIRQQLFLVQTRQAALAERFGPRHPEMRAVEQQIATWQQRLQEVIHRAPKIMHQELQAAELYEQKLADLYKEEFSEAKTVDGYLLEEQQLLGGIHRVQSIHDSILTQVQQWQLADQALAEGRSGVKVSELETPAMTERVIFPPPLLLAFLCVVVGLIGGSAAITILEHTNTRVQSPEQLQKHLDRNVVGRIPAMSVPRDVLAKPVFRSRLVRELPESSVAEAFRALRTRLATDAGGNGNGRGRVIQLAGSREGDGKTTVTANLAFSFAQLGKRTLVIDTDLRNGMLHQVFDVSNTTGLTSVLQGTASLHHAIEHSPLAAVDLLSRGPAVDNPVELLAQPAFDDVLESARGRYDVILLDTSPLLTVTDPSVLAPKADAVLLSTVVGRSSIVDVRRACELLDTLEAKTVGIVVNRIPTGRRDSSYYTPRAAG